MRFGFDEGTVHSMYRSLAREGYTYFGRDPESIPNLEISPIEHWMTSKANPTIMQTSFDNYMNPWVSEVERNTATGIRVNSHYLDYLYEDEMIVALLHEVAHAHAGLDAQHGPEWARAADEIGSLGQPQLQIRLNVMWLEDKGYQEYVEKFLDEVPTLGHL